MPEFRVGARPYRLDHRPSYRRAEQYCPFRHFYWVQPLLLQGFFGALNEGMQPLLPINGPAQLKEKLEHILTVCWMNSH
jgi:hypothetical protein